MSNDSNGGEGFPWKDVTKNLKNEAEVSAWWPILMEAKKLILPTEDPRPERNSQPVNVMANEDKAKDNIDDSQNAKKVPLPSPNTDSTDRGITKSSGLDKVRETVGNLRNYPRKRILTKKVSVASLGSTASTSSGAPTSATTDSSVTSKSMAYTPDSASNYSAPTADNNRLMVHAKKGDWANVELIIRYSRRGDPELFAMDDDTGENPFMLACRDNKLVIVERLIELGVNINDRTKDNRNALHFAAASAKEDVVLALLKRKIDSAVAGGPKVQTPLHIACSRTGSDSRAVVAVLLRYLKPEHRLTPDKDGDIPLFLCVESGNQGAARDVISSNTEQQMKYQKPNTLDYVLHIACRKRELDIVRLLCENHCPINIKNANGQSPLHIAAEMGDEAIIKYLYSVNADANICDNMDRSPLHIAAEKGRTAVVDVLTTRFKSSVLARTKDGSTLMHISAECGHPDTSLLFLKKGVPLHMPNKFGAICLHAAAKNGHTSVVKALLEKGAQVEARTKDNLTPLHVAVKYCHPAVVEMLLGFAAPVEVKGGKMQETPLHFAAKIKKGNKVAKMLLKSGAEPNHPREDGETALHIAARHGYVENGIAKTVKLLLDEGGDPMLQSRNGENSLHVAVRHCKWHVVEYIVTFLNNKKSALDVAMCINMENKEGETPVHLAAELTSSQASFEGEEEKIMKLLLKNNGDLGITTKLTQETALHYGARSGNKNTLQSIINHIGSKNMPSVINKQAKNGWSPLLFACEEGHIASVDILLEQHARVDVFDENGKAALHLAAENGHEAITKRLLVKKAFVNAKTKLGLTPLHLAAQNGYQNIVMDLLNNFDATLDAMSLDKKTPLHKAAENGQIFVCKTLLDKKANVYAVDIKGQTPLHLAAENDHSKVVEQFLKYHSSLATMMNKAGATCAHIAAVKGSVAVIKELLKFDKENVTTARKKSPDKSTALMLAAAEGHSEVVTLLINAGSDPMFEDADGMNTLHIIAKYGHTKVISAIKDTGSDIKWKAAGFKTGFNALHVATQYGQEEFAREMLIRISATVPSSRVSKDQDSKEYGFTPLHLASQSGHVNLVRMILNCPGVDGDAKTAVEGTTALHLAAKCGHVAVVGLLLSKSLDQIKCKDNRGCICLHYAASNGHLDMVSLLIGQGAEINAENKKNYTPLHLAASSGHLGVVKLLIEAGASSTRKTNDGKTSLQLAAAEKHPDTVSYLLQQPHNTYQLLSDKTFVVDLMLVARTSPAKKHDSDEIEEQPQRKPYGRAGRLKPLATPLASAGKKRKFEPFFWSMEEELLLGHSMAILQEFVMASPAPIETAAKLSREFRVASSREKEQAKELQECARYSESLAVELLEICSAQNGSHEILKATDDKGTPFLDTLMNCEQKNVMAHPTVQKYLSDVWVGNLKWSDTRFVLLFFAMLICPFVWIIFSLPVSGHFYNVPIIKFIVYLVSHVYLVILFVITVAIPIKPIYEQADLMPEIYEWLLLIWISGELVNELLTTSERSGIGWIRTFNLTLCAFAVVIHLTGFAFECDPDNIDACIRLDILYIRNIFLSAALTLAFIQFLEFLSFHYLFGPWSIIIEGLVYDLFKFGVIVLMFMLAFSMWLAAVYQPVYENPTNVTAIVYNGATAEPVRVQNAGYTFQILFFALFGLIEPQSLPPINRNPHFTIYLVQVVFGLYHIVTLIVLINLLIAMMSDTYQRIEQQSDTEWKFGRSKLIRNMKRSRSPSPVNLITTLYQYIKIWYKKKGCIVDLSEDLDEVESVTGAKSMDHLVNNHQINLSDESTMRKSLQDVVDWSRVRKKFWLEKGRPDLAQSDSDRLNVTVSTAI